MESGQWHLPTNVEYGYNLICGNNVFINFSATFLAQAKIRLGAGTLVTKDVPDNSLVLGSPGRVVRKLG